MPDDDDFVVEEVDASSSTSSEDDQSWAPKHVIARAVDLVKSGIKFLTRNGHLTHATPLPPPSDVAELEYISALHQCASMKALRQDGSITADEIAIFLKSRHGIKVTPGSVRTVVLDGLTADPEQDGEGGVMDLVELTSALIIPNLVRLRRKKVNNKLRDSSGRARTHVRSLLPSRKNRPRDRHFGADRTISDNVGILRDVLNHILEDCTGDSAPKLLDADLVRVVLRGYGEGALANDEDLVNEMVEVAASGSISGRTNEEFHTTPLDVNTFVEALTSDVARKCDPERDERPSTHFQDVWVYTSGRDENDISAIRENRRWDEESGKLNTAYLLEHTLWETIKGPKCKRKQHMESSEPQDQDGGDCGHSSGDKIIIERYSTWGSIDYTVDNFRRQWVVISLWISFVAFFVAYLGFSFQSGSDYRSKNCTTDDNGMLLDNSLRNTVVCPLVSGIVSQLLMISELILFGAPFIILGSIGNEIDATETITQMGVGIVLFAVFVFVPFFARFEVPYWISSGQKGDRLSAISLGCGAVVLFMQLLHLVMLLCRKYFPHRRKMYLWYFQLGSVRYVSMIKHSALFKADRMLSNAHRIHRNIIKRKSVRGVAGEDNSSQFLSNIGWAMQEYFKVDGKRTYIGGIGWTWKRIIDGTLFTQEGIWLSGRVLAGTVFQLIVIIASPILVWYAFPIFEARLNPYDDKVIETRSKVVVGIGATCAFITSILLTALFIPTMVSTTLKFRRGVLPSLRSEDFLLRYRFALDQVGLVYGGMFWGVLFSSVAIGLVTGGFIYLLIWDRTSRFLLGFIGNLIGILLITIAKIAVMQVLRFTYYAAFYRRKPFAANLLAVVIEVYSIAISIWFMAVRCIKIIIIAAMYLGRIDTPLFAPGVGIFGPLEIDNWPTVSRKEILIHEAHRHPYLETLGYLYMMQLRFRNGGFAKRANSAWRLVFVLALMPWLHKYRDMTRPGHFGDEADDEDSCDESSAMMLALAAQSIQSIPDEMQFQHSKSIQFKRQSMVMKQSMVSPRFLQESPKSPKLGLATVRRHRIERIKQEMECLQKELSALELNADKMKDEFTALVEVESKEVDESSPTLFPMYKLP